MSQFTPTANYIEIWFDVSSQGMPTFYAADTTSKQNNDTIEDQNLVHEVKSKMDCCDDDRIPRIKGFIELLNQCFGDKSNLGP